MTEQLQESRLDRKDLKIQAFKERIAELSFQYEDRDADRRVDLTEAASRIQELEQQVSTLTEELSRYSELQEDEETNTTDSR